MKKITIILILILLPFISFAGEASSTTKIQGYGQMILTNLAFSLQKSQNFYTQTQIKAEKMDQAGKPMTEINKKLIEIKTILDRSQTNLDYIQNNLDKMSWVEIRQRVRAVIQDIRLAHGKIKKLNKLLD